MADAKRNPAQPTISDIEEAAASLKGAVLRTQFLNSRTLSSLYGCEIWLKFENHQFTASFKERGALNHLHALGENARRRGVIAMSAGNHAQGVAYHAQQLGIPATIVMPEGTPQVKIDNTENFGAEVLVTGTTLEESTAAARHLCKERGLTFVHPYDDPLVIAGQGTLALEMLDEKADLDCLVVPIGGGGLISGMAIAARSRKPGIEIIGVQTRLYPSMYNEVKHADLPARGDTLAEGIAVKSPGNLTRDIVGRDVDDIVLVNEIELERALAQLITIEKTVVEGAGAAGLAAILSDPGRFSGKRVGVVLSGGNLDTRLLAGVLTRDLARQGRISQLIINLQDRPGQLARVAVVLAEAGANVVEVLHQRVFSNLPAKGAVLEVVIETRDRKHLVATIEALRSDGLEVTCDTV
ncbi:MAG: threonine ammonia-lyase [Hyphomicrobiaceae bacterium]